MYRAWLPGGKERAESRQEKSAVGERVEGSATMQYSLLCQALKDFFGLFLCKGSHCVQVGGGVVAVLGTMEMGWGWVGRSKRDTCGCLCWRRRKGMDDMSMHQLRTFHRNRRWL